MQTERKTSGPGTRGPGGGSFASVLSASGLSDSPREPKAEENGPAGSPDAWVQVQTDGLMGRWWRNAWFGRGGEAGGRGDSAA